LHRMPALALEVDGHLIDQKIDAIDLAEAPALVQDVNARRELFESSALCGGDLSGFDDLLYFGTHGEKTPNLRGE
jgi:hypothetical protein